MMSVSLLPTRSPWKVFVMWARASATPSRSSCGGCVSKRSMSNVPSALLIPATLPHRCRPAAAGAPGRRRVRAGLNARPPTPMDTARASFVGRAAAPFSGAVLEDIQVVEHRRHIGKCHVLLRGRLRLWQFRVLHRRLVRVEEHDREVAARLVAVGRQDLPPDGALALAGPSPPLVGLADGVEIGSAELDHLHKTHLLAPPVDERCSVNTSPRRGADQ